MARSVQGRSSASKNAEQRSLSTQVQLISEREIRQIHQVCAIGEVDKVNQVWAIGLLQRVKRAAVDGERTR